MSEKLATALMILWIVFLACCIAGAFDHFLMMIGVLK